ncbi:MAG TPA: zf-HC2 domain-containing protein [Pseudacidobacterium sp.]|nr:zf-HC2 domain-containing protein [Pseudacidobacterium sp.]
MSERNPFRQNSGGPLDCETWEALLADALDGTLSARDQAAFTAHSQDCAICAEMLAQAKQGQEWMRFLHEEPDAPGDLISKILGRTSGATLPQLAVAGGGVQPIAPHIAQAAMRRAFHDSRLLMTVAMAFFSIALTLNMLGVNLKGVRLADLKPSALQTTIARQIYGAKKQMVSYYENLRWVYELDSRLRELRRDAETEQQPQKEQKNDKQPHKNGGKVTTPKEAAPSTGILQGKEVMASVDMRSKGKAGPSATPQNPNSTVHPQIKSVLMVLNDCSRKYEVRYAAHQKSEVNELAVRFFAAQAERSLA